MGVSCDNKGSQLYIISVCVFVSMCVGAHMLVCVRYTELTCIPDVWHSGHYGSGPRPYVLGLCVCMFVCVGACMLV